MRKITVIILVAAALSLLVISPAAAKGGAGPCIASCCLDPRLGYEMNEGKDIHMYDWINLIGTFVSARPLTNLIPAVLWGLEESGPAGFCVGVIWGPRAGRDFSTTRLRTKELLLCIPIINLYPVIVIPMEAMEGKTWGEVVQEEGLKR